jgi:lysyl-tRNA synthetase class 2
LIVGGFEGMNSQKTSGMKEWITHNPEFTAMEIYVAYKDYNWMMKFAEDLLEHCAIAVNGTSSHFWSA